MKAMRLRYVAALISLLLPAGCGRVRYPTNYILNLPVTVPHVANSTASLGTVVVRPFRCPDYLCQGRIVYRPSPDEVGFYEYHRWAMDPRESVTAYVVESLRNQALFRHVSSGERGVEPAYLLTGTINALEEVDQGRNVRVVCALSAQLVEAQSASVVWSDTASEVRTVDERKVSGLVSAMSSAAQATVDQLTTSLAKELGSARERAQASK